MSILSKNNFFFIGVGGAGMSAIAQYLSGQGKTVKGSDRLFADEKNNYIQKQLSLFRVACFIQDGSGIDEHTEAIVISTAIEDSNIEIAKAKTLGIPIILRADLLAAICESKNTIAVAGTSGKSTVTAMLFHILHSNGLSPSLITGAGLCSLQKNGSIGNAYVGESDILVIEADESDGTLVKYKPQVGLLLSIDKDHKELDELFTIFETFKKHTQKYFVVNRDHALAQKFSSDSLHDFGNGTPIQGDNFLQEGFSISFQVGGVPFQIPTIGRHNMENALACIAVARLFNVSLEQCADALKNYEGIYRRHQFLGEHKGILVIDDYAHNPAKIAASIKACQPIGKRLIAWFQPHGYGPTKFIRKELVSELTNTLRKEDAIWMSEIYYAGGTAVKDISALDLIQDLQKNNVNAYFKENREQLFKELLPSLQQGDVLLMMGARDPSLEHFAHELFRMLKEKV
ncbi:MAG: Mur ligase family protein [Chitinophagaceae bacterium]